VVTALDGTRLTQGDDRATVAVLASVVDRAVVGAYALDGRERRVRCDITPILITDRRPNPYVVVPHGRRQVQVDLRLVDSGRDPLDLLIVRFIARDRGGERLAEAFRLPSTKLRPDDPQSPRRLSVGFMVRRGQRLASLEMRSTLEDLSARVRWRLKR
jgi:hypothetical protein